MVEMPVTPCLRRALELPADVKILMLEAIHSGYDDPGWCACDPDDSRAPESEHVLDDVSGIAAGDTDRDLTKNQIDTLLDNFHEQILDLI
jgi:hypothetical protein